MARGRRCLVLSDLHCGHRAGLTPPGWWYAEDAEEHARKWRITQRESWDTYVSLVRELGPFDAVVCNGDAIDGKGERSGGKEQIVADRLEQVRMAAYAIRQAQTIRRGVLETPTVIVRGTPYHTGSAEDFEDVLGGEVGARKVGNHEWVDFFGVILDFKHKVGSSQIPYGRMTPLAREKTWNTIWALEQQQAPHADAIVRSHVHYHVYGGAADWFACTTPALQTLGSDYGARQCSGVVDWGLLVFEVGRGNRRTRRGVAWDWICRCVRLTEAAPSLIEIGGAP